MNTVVKITNILVARKFVGSFEPISIWEKRFFTIDSGHLIQSLGSWQLLSNEEFAEELAAYMQSDIYWIKKIMRDHAE